MSHSENRVRAERLTVLSIGINLALAAVMLAAGFAARSSAVLSDGVNTASDVLSTLIVLVGLRMSGKASDREHPYGHERLECVAALILSFILFLTGGAIGIDGIAKVQRALAGEVLHTPGAIAIAAAGLSIGVKELMFWYTIRAAKSTGLSSLRADAWHHRSDSRSSLAGLVGIAGGRLGLPVLDPAAALVICLFIFKVAYDIAVDALSKMIDRSCDDATVEALCAAAMRQPGVRRIDSVKTRLFASRFYVDIEIAADASLTLEEGHNIAQAVHDDIEREFPDAKHCTVHVNPYTQEDA